MISLFFLLYNADGARFIVNFSLFNADEARFTVNFSLLNANFSLSDRQFLSMGTAEFHVNACLE